MQIIKVLSIIFAGILLIAGCAGKPEVSKENRIFLTVEFQQAKPLRYRFVSTRQIETIFEDNTIPENDRKTTYSESLETVIAYKPIKIETYGLSEIEATIESVNANPIMGGTGKDATANLSGKSFRLVVGPTGKIEDRKELVEIMKQAAQTAFRPKRDTDRIKNPDMISDFMATQMFLWDSISSIKEPRKGITLDQNWQSELSIPSPVLALFYSGRDVVYKLTEIRDTNDGKIAVISSEYTPSKTPVPNWFSPYEGDFMLAGPFGLYVNCTIAELGGKGTELFNIDQGKSISYRQDYQVAINSMMSLIPIKVKINIKQQLSMQLLN
jgi:hypothetical protein